MRFPLAIVLLVAALAAHAQMTYRWIDKEGKVHYTDRPPAPGEAARVEQKRPTQLGADQTMSYALRQATAEYPVMLYTQTDCGEVCKQARDHLARRGVPFSEKTVTTADDLKALRTLVGEGDLIVPVVQVGGKSSRGYLASSWDSLLDAAGYPKANAKPAGR
ncbi:MAG: glutaredoxin family protein [Rhodocyclaceae bacterium]|nr:glutaredoxin family protein [Rhodocyclaceae bacterium]